MNILEDNVRQLMRRCAPPVDVERALRRFESRREPRGRGLAAAAAIGLIALTLWLAVPSKPAVVPAQEKPADLARLISELASETPGVRAEAERKLLAIGAPVLEDLDRAFYHEIAEVRVKSKELAEIIRRRAAIEPYVAFVQASVRIARKRWIARDFKDIEAMVQDAFSPAAVNVRYVPMKVIEEKGRRKEGVLLPGVAAALDAGPGIVFLDAMEPGRMVEFGSGCLFTLPDKVGWSAYVGVVFSDDFDPSFSPRPRLNCYQTLTTEQWTTVWKGLRLEAHAAGSAQVTAPGTYGNRAPMLLPGDILRELNGKRGSLEEARALFSAVPAAPREGAAPAVTVTVDREGKIFDLACTLLLVKAKK